MARFHAIWAGLFVLIFLATGQYMEATFPDLYRGDATMRMLYRSAHVYILLAAFINAALAINLRPQRGWRRWVQLAGCLLIAVSPAIFLLAFFLEPAPGRLVRPYALAGVISAFVGIVLAGIASLQSAQRAGETSDAP